MDDDQTGIDIAKLQAELAFQGETVQRLNDALGTQQQEILMLQRQVELLGERLRNLRQDDGSGEGTQTQEKPPHY
ncbi:SlyX family protein [Congregibacter sp.]|uniref:SlyX family protein n=1 Tax=Congregibacter sp. TaxID=2744308 RepID=UPI003F6A9F1B